MASRPGTQTRKRPAATRPAATRPTSANVGGEAHLLERTEILPGYLSLTWSLPALARSVRPGQYLHVLEPRHAGSLLPAVPIAGFDRVGGTVATHVPSGAPLLDGLRSLRVGDRATLDGPLGRSFEMHAQSRYLLLVADSVGYGRVRACVDQAVAGGHQVTLLLGASSVADVVPSSSLPDEAEYAVATMDGSLGHHGPVTDLVPQYEAWADQCFVAGETELLRTMAALARSREERMGVARLGRRRRSGRVRGAVAATSETRGRAWLQLALPHAAGCALAICLGCSADGVEGPVRVCREGPTFTADELRWDPPS